MYWYWHFGGKKKGEKSEKGPEWVEEEEKDGFPGFSHITSVAMAILWLSVLAESNSFIRSCTARQFRWFSFGSVGDRQQGCFLQKVVCGGCDRERRRVCKYALAWSLLLPGCRLGHVCVQHPAQLPPEFQLELLGRAMVQISKKCLGQESENSAITPSGIWRTTNHVLYPKVSFMCSQTSRMRESVESQILSLVKHRLTHKLLITLKEIWQTRICGKSESLEMTYLYSTSWHYITATLFLQDVILEALPCSRPWGWTQPSSSA